MDTRPDHDRLQRLEPESPDFEDKSISHSSSPKLSSIVKIANAKIQRRHKGVTINAPQQHWEGISTMIQ